MQLLRTLAGLEKGSPAYKAIEQEVTKLEAKYKNPSIRDVAVQRVSGRHPEAPQLKPQPTAEPPKWAPKAAPTTAPVLGPALPPDWDPTKAKELARQQAERAKQAKAKSTKEERGEGKAPQGSGWVYSPYTGALVPLGALANTEEAKAYWENPLYGWMVTGRDPWSQMVRQTAGPQANVPSPFGLLGAEIEYGLRSLGPYQELTGQSPEELRRQRIAQMFGPGAGTPGQAGTTTGYVPQSMASYIANMPVGTATQTLAQQEAAMPAWVQQNYPAVTPEIWASLSERDKLTMRNRLLGLPTPDEADALEQQRQQNLLAALRDQAALQAQINQEMADSAYRAWLQEQQWTVPAGTEYQPMFEPGGLYEAIARMGHFSYNPEAYRVVPAPAAPRMAAPDLSTMNAALEQYAKTQLGK